MSLNYNMRDQDQQHQQPQCQARNIANKTQNVFSSYKGNNEIYNVVVQSYMKSFHEDVNKYYYSIRNLFT
jgi:hypothetical protein